MWTLILIYALRALSAPPFPLPSVASLPAAPASPPAGVSAAAPGGEVGSPEKSPRDMSLDEVAAVEPLVRQYLGAARDANGQLANLRVTLGQRHPRVNEARSRAKVMMARAEEFAARYRQNPRSLNAYANPEIRKSLRAIDQIDIELEMLRPNAGPTHPRVRTLRYYRDLHEKQIEKILWGGMT